MNARDWSRSLVWEVEEKSSMHGKGKEKTIRIKKMEREDM